MNLRIFTFPLLAFAALMLAGCIWWVSAGEVLMVRAVETVPLFDPGTLAGQMGDLPKQVGYLAPGEELPVVGCVDRKSDINLHASYGDKVVAVGEWKARVELFRGHAYLWEPGATTSCRGFFEGISIPI